MIDVVVVYVNEVIIQLLIFVQYGFQVIVGIGVGVGIEVDEGVGSSYQYYCYGKVMFVEVVDLVY